MRTPIIYLPPTYFNPALLKELLLLKIQIDHYLLKIK